MSLYYLYLKKMSQWKPFFILTYLGSFQENEFHYSYWISGSFCKWCLFLDYKINFFAFLNTIHNNILLKRLSINKVGSNILLCDFRWQNSLPFIFSVVLRTGATSEIKFAEVTGGGGGAKAWSGIRTGWKIIEGKIEIYKELFTCCLHPWRQNNYSLKN